MFIFQAAPEEPPGDSPAAASASAPASLSESHAPYTHPRAGPTERAGGGGGARKRARRQATEGEEAPAAGRERERGKPLRPLRLFWRRGAREGPGELSLPAVRPPAALRRGSVAAARLQRSGADIFQLPRFHYGQLRFGAPAGMGPGFSLVRLSVALRALRLPWISTSGAGVLKEPRERATPIL